MNNSGKKKDFEMGRGFPGGPPIEYKEPDNSLPNVQQPSKPKPKAQEFADQKKEEVKKTYSNSHSDRINNAYRDHYGRDAHAEEISNWTGTGMGIEDIQKGLKTSFARDGEHLRGDQLSALQIQQPGGNEEGGTRTQPQQPQQPQQPETPTQNQKPTVNQPGTNTSTNISPVSGETRSSEDESRMAGSRQFQLELGEAQGIIAPYQSNIDQDLNKGRERVDRVNSDGVGFVRKYDNYNREAQAASNQGSPFDIANQAVDNAKRNSSVDLKAMDRNIRKTPLYSGARSELFGLQVFGDKYRNARENPVSWKRPDAANPVETPDFQQIYKNTKKDLDNISI